MSDILACRRCGRLFEFPNGKVISQKVLPDVERDAWMCGECFDELGLERGLFYEGH